MTTQQPTCEYLRTLEEVGTFCIIKDDWVDVTVCNNCPANRSRPAPAPSQEVICELCHRSQKCCRDSARAATLKTLDYIEGELYPKSEILTDEEGVGYCVITLSECDSIIESLRQQQAGEP